MLKTTMTKVAMILASVVPLALTGCSHGDGGSGGSSEQRSGEGTHQAATAEGGGAAGGEEQAHPTKASDKVLLVAQSTFRRNEKGRYTTPDKARLYILRFDGSRWQREVIEDGESNVFHKGMVLAEEGQPPKILTIGGEKAILKLWTRHGSTWQPETVWQKNFGGRISRLRDVELGDVTGDGRTDIVLATHDQGVVEVLRRTDSGWEPMELDRTPDIFVHEVEIGDVDGDGHPEIYATPSHPNKGTGGAQSGKIVSFRWNGSGFDKTVVAEWSTRHAKEVLVTDLTGDGRPELYAALEAETEAGSGLGGKLVHPVQIIRLDRSGDRWESKVVATIEGERFTRFLVGGDLDHDGSAELIAATASKGIWMFEPGSSLPFSGRQLTDATGGFEHAILLADYDGDGTQELYVADDNHGRLVRFTWDNGHLSSPDVLLTRTVPQSAITWNLWVADLPR